MQDEALDAVERAGAPGDGDAYTLCVHQPDWHQGVIGIVASRLKDRYHRPVVVFAQAGAHELRGSGRSIAGFHLRDALDLCAKRAPGIILRFGGHAYAAGVSIAPDSLPCFAATFEAVAREALTDAALRRTHESDGALDAGELTYALGAELRQRAWGQGFPAPAFDSGFDVADQRSVGDGHAKLLLARGRERFPAIAFRTRSPLPPRIHALFRPEINRYQGLSSLELVIDYWSAAN
jgi:single-stranded-DNA-specific exonuclease